MTDTVGSVRFDPGPRPELGVAEVVLFVLGLTTVVIGLLLMSAVVAPGSSERRRAARIRDLEDELERLKGSTP